VSAWVTGILTISTAIGLAFAAESTGSNSRTLNFAHDIAPLLQKHCQECHRPGEIGPMPLLTYQQVRPWAKAIRAAVLQRIMPPWDADQHFGKFSNDRSLSETDIQTIVSWVDGGSIEGNPAEAPKPREFADEWRIGKPDLIFEMPKEFAVPATGVVEYQWIKIPSRFTEDKWVEAVEVRPGNPAVVHHAVVYAREPGLTYAKEAKYNEFFQLSGEDVVDVIKNRSKGDTMFSSTAEPEHLQVFAPGADPILLEPGQARLVKAGSDIIFEMHYTPNGTATTDRTRVGLRFSKTAPTERVRTVRLNNGVPLIIPPGDSSYRLESRIETLAPVKIVSFMPHMHLRGKSMEFRVAYPTGETETLLSVPRYDFHWQMTYYLKEPKILPKGTIITCVAVYDNSPNNRYNPDPQAVVKGGRQSWEEMMAGFVDFGIGPTQSLDLFHDAPKTTVQAQR
jgi:copper type II ascorbate-dependent monooxygenase-like protein